METVATLPGGWRSVQTIRLEIEPFAELVAHSESLTGSQVDSPFLPSQTQISLGNRATVSTDTGLPPASPARPPTPDYPPGLGEDRRIEVPPEFAAPRFRPPGVLEVVAEVRPAVDLDEQLAQLDERQPFVNQSPSSTVSSVFCSASKGETIRSLPSMRTSPP